MLFFPTKKDRPTNTRCQFYFGWSRWWLLHWKCHGRTGPPWRVFLRHACAETLSLSQRCAQKKEMISKGESEREQHSMCLVLYVYEFMCNPWIYLFFIVSIPPGFHLTVGGTGAPSDSIVVPQVQVLVNLTGTQWKPVNLGHLHQDFWSFVDGYWEETASCPVSLCIAHINMHIQNVYTYNARRNIHIHILCIYTNILPKQQQSFDSCSIACNFFLHDAGIVQPATQVSTWWPA